MRRVQLVVCATAYVLCASRASARADASAFPELGQDVVDRGTVQVRLTGSLRLRTELLDNLDLDRGLTPSGDALFPVPAGDPTGQVLTHADLRFRTDLAIYAPGGGVAVKARLDVLALALGSLPDGVPVSSTAQRPDAAGIRVRRAWGEAVTPFGVLAAGRMGNAWGLGILANGGDCEDCDAADSADRIAFVTPIAGHVWALAYDFSAAGPLGRRPSGARGLDLDPTDDVRTVTFALLRWRDDNARTRRRRAGKTTVEYGAWISHRWQDNDVPSTYVPAVSWGAYGPSQVVARGATASAFDAWGRVTLPWGRIEAEGVVSAGSIEQATLLPGALLRDPVESLQIGAALEADVGLRDWPFSGGIDVGFASGDPAPGFGAFPTPGAPPPRAGDLDGAQAIAPSDTRVDNFRFHPSYHVDRILFREIIGTVTDAIYVRPRLHWRLPVFGAGAIEFELAAVASFAVEAASTPGGSSALGVEIDPSVGYRSTDGFVAVLEHALLFPLAGLDNPAAGLTAKPAQLLRARLGYTF